jgi:uncharacterized phage protein (TIGR01671 family)
MREIIFRGKRVDNGKWVEGCYVNHLTRMLCPIGDFLKEGDEKHYIVKSGFADWNMPRDLEFVEVIPETVGQSTGRTDKNGKRVFEGDILCADTGRRWVNGNCTDYTQYVVVVYNSQKARFEILGKLGQSHKALDQVIDKCSATVAGNIHDNPELLT